MRFHSCPVVLGLCLLAPASAAAQTVYFSVGKEIRTVELTATGATTPSLVHTSTMFVGDLALCAGNAGGPASDTGQYLYFVERNAAGDSISRLDVKRAVPRRATQNPSAQVVFPVPIAKGRVGELRLTTTCEVMFATTTGVFKVNGTSPFSGTANPLPNATDPIETVAGSGLALAFDGSLRYSDGSAVQSLSGFSATAAAPIVGLGVASAGHGSLTSALLPAAYEDHPLPVGPVCASAANKVTCYRKSGGTAGMTTFAEFAAGNKAQFFDFLADDRAIVATSVVADAGLGGSSKFNGILWRVEASGVITELTRGPKVSGEYVPIVGVAVGPSTAVVTSAKGTQHKVNFGPVAFDAATQSECGLTVTWRQLTWPEAEAKIGQLSSPNYSIDPGSGGESWIDNVDVDVAEGDDCGPTPLVGIAQYVDNQPSRAVVHCHDDVCELATHGNYPYSTPDDERDSGLPDNFSDFLTAQIAIAPGSTGAPVFSSPLNNDAKVVDTIDATEAAAASSHNASGGLSIRFRICTDASCTTVFPAEEENPPFTGAGLSVTRLSDDTIPVPLADCIVIDQGASTPDLPVFRTTNPDGVTHNFNLNTPIDGPPACQQSGLFVATVFSHSGKFTKTSILFRLN